MNFEDIIYNFALSFPGLLLALVCHELGHAFVADRKGDPTARNLGRLTFNPIPHMDLFGSFLFPLLCTAMGGAVFLAWAKPIPINDRYFRNPRRDNFWVSFAGPLANFTVVIIGCILLAILLAVLSPTFYLYSPLMQILRQIVYINTMIGMFNLIPFPPLDGSHMVASFLDYPTQQKYMQLERFSIIFFLLLITTGATRFIFYPALMLTNFFMNFCIQIIQ